MSEHILNIRLQFEKLAPTAMKEQTTTISQKVEDSFKKGAVAGGEAMLDQIKSVQQAWAEFDWAHPIQSARDLWDTFTDRMKDSFGWFSVPILGAIAAIGKNLWDMITGVQPALVRMFSMMSGDFINLDKSAQSMGARVSKALQDINEVAFETTASISDVSEQFISMAQQRVPYESLKELTKYSILGAKALGANQAQLTDMIASLKVIGGVSDELIIGAGGILRTFADVQEAVGLTEQEMSGMIGTVSKLTRAMSAFGASQKDIVAMAEATAKLTGLFGSLGLGADRAGEIMEKLFDPTRIGENALLISRMGINMNEYLTMLRGGAVDQRKLTEGLIDAADEVNQILEQTGNIYAANARAQMLGFNNAQEAIRLAIDGREKLDRMAKGEKTLEEQAAEGMSSLNEQIAKLGNVIGAFFGKRLAGLIGLVTDLFVTLNDLWLKNSDAIDKFFDEMFKGIIDFIKNLKPDDIINFFKGIGDSIGGLINFLKDAMPYIIGFGVALLALKFIGPLTGMIGGLGQTISGLGQSAGAAAQGMGSFSQSLGAGLQMFMQMAGVALVMLAVGAAIFLIATGIGFLAQQPWEQIAAAAGILALFIGALVALGLFFTTPIGAIALAGMTAMAGVLVLLGIAIAGIGLGFMLIADNIMEMANGLSFFAEISSKLKDNFVDLIDPLTEFGVAIGKMVSSIKDKGRFEMFAKNLSDLAIGFYILSKAIEKLDNVSQLSIISESFEGIRKGIEALSVGPFVGDMRAAGEGFKTLAEGIMVLADPKIKDLDTSVFGEIGIRIDTFLKALKQNTGWFENLKNTGEGFKELSVGIYILAKTAPMLSGITEGMEEAASGVSKLLQAMASTSGSLMTKDQLVGLGEGFKELSLGMYILTKADLSKAAANLKEISGPIADIVKSVHNKGNSMQAAGMGLSQLFIGLGKLPERIPRLSELAFDIGLMTEVLTNFKGEASSATKEFTNFMKEMENVKPIRIISEDSDVSINGKKKEEISLIRSLDVAIKESFAEEVDRIVESIDKLNNSIATSNQLASDSLAAIKVLKSLAQTRGIVTRNK